MVRKEIYNRGLNQLQKKLENGSTFLFKKKRGYETLTIAPKKISKGSEIIYFKDVMRIEYVVQIGAPNFTAKFKMVNKTLKKKIDLFPWRSDELAQWFSLHYKNKRVPHCKEIGLIINYYFQMRFRSLPIERITDSSNYVMLKGEKIYVKNNSLDLSSREIDDIMSIEGLGQVRNLKILKLNYNKITNIEGLENFVELEILYLNNNNIKLVEGLSSLEKLKKLYLANNKISEIKGFENLKSIEEIDLRYNNIEGIPDLKTISAKELVEISVNNLKT